MLTARAENHIRKNPDLDDTIARLKAYEEAGADVLYAPGLRNGDEIRAVCEATSKPVNVLGHPGLSVSEITAAGGRRISVGSQLTWSPWVRWRRPPKRCATAATSRRCTRRSGSRSGSDPEDRVLRRDATKLLVG